MTTALTNIGDFISINTKPYIKETQKITKMDCLILYLKIKQIIKLEKSKELLKEYIVRDKKINSGRYTIKGTRVTPEDIWDLILDKENVSVEEISAEFPSIENEAQITAALIFCAKNKINLFKVIF